MLWHIYNSCINMCMIVYNECIIYVYWLEKVIRLFVQRSLYRISEATIKFSPGSNCGISYNGPRGVDERCFVTWVVHKVVHLLSTKRFGLLQLTMFALDIPSFPQDKIFAFIFFPVRFELYIKATFSLTESNCYLPT